MEKQVMFVCAFAALVAVALGAGATCTSACKDYKACSSLNATSTYTGFLKNSLLCSSEIDTKLGVLFNNMSSCALIESAIEVADILNITWDGVSSIEAIIGDEDFWLVNCTWKQLAAAACIYNSVPAKGGCTSPTVEQENLFCPGECMKIANSCFNLKKYRQLSSSIEDFCTGVSATSKTATNCYKGQIDQNGVTAPDCSDKVVKATSLTGPYILGGIALALAVVGLIGLALITCRSGAGGGAPNSF